MKYLSTSEIAAKWGVSRKTVNRYAAQGRIKGAYIVGKTWMIPEDIRKEDCSLLPATEEEGAGFPLYAYRDFYTLKDRLKTEPERKLYSAFDHALSADFEPACRLANEAYAGTEDLPIRVTCLYLMCRCTLYLQDYPGFVKHVLKLNCLFEADFPYKEELRALVIDIETYYKGFRSLQNATFRPAYEYCEEGIPIITTTALYKQIIIALKKKEQIDTVPYELLLQDFERKGYVYPSVMLRSELAFIYYHQRRYLEAYAHIMTAYEVAEEHHAPLMMTEIYSIEPKIVDKGLKYYGKETSPELRNLAREFKKAYVGLMIYLKKPRALFEFMGDDMDFIVYAIRGYTNKEIASEKGISENAVFQRYSKLYDTFYAANKKELILKFMESIDQ